MKGKLIFVKGYGLSPSARQDLKNVSTPDDIDNSKELKLLLDKWEKTPGGSATQTVHSLDQLAFVIDESVLRSRKVFYIRELDIVVCLNPDRTVHPYSHTGQLVRRDQEVRQDVSEISNQTRRFFTWNVLIIDNAGKIGPRWVNLHGNVHLIRSVQDPNSKDGFYVVRDKPVEDARSGSVPTSDFKESEDELDFPIYKSYQEAEIAGDTESVVKLRFLIEERKLKELELETRHSRAVADADKLREDIKQQLRKNEEAEKQHEREMEAIRVTMAQERERAAHEKIRFENEIQRFEHDRITQSQKNVGESVKVIGAVITGIIGLLAIAIKWLK